jgi:hypothetical protein
MLSIKSQTQERGEPKYKLVDLELGDLLFTTDPNSQESALIRAATKSFFSHVAIYKGEFNFLEAADYGVLNFNHMRFGIRDKANVQVRRLSPLIPNRDRLALAAVEAAEKYRERDYWTPGAILSAFKLARRIASKIRLALPDEEKGFFCSYLVGLSYVDAGVSLCGKLKPHEIHPGDLLGSPKLIDVSDICIVELAPWDKRSDSIDAGYLSSPFQRYSAARRQILEEIRIIMTRIDLPSPATLDKAFETVVMDTNIDRQRKIDAEIADCLVKNAYVNLPLVYTSDIPGDKVGEINGTPYSEIPLSTLRATLLAHMALHKKWEVRLNDFVEEKEAAQELKRRIKVKVLELLETYTKNQEIALLKACTELDQTILEIQQYIEKAEFAQRP